MYIYLIYPIMLCVDDKSVYRVNIMNGYVYA